MKTLQELCNFLECYGAVDEDGIATTLSTSKLGICGRNNHDLKMWYPENGCEDDIICRFKNRNYDHIELPDCNWKESLTVPQVDCPDCGGEGFKYGADGKIDGHVCFTCLGKCKIPKEGKI